MPTVRRSSTVARTPAPSRRRGFTQRESDTVISLTKKLWLAEDKVRRYGMGKDDVTRLTRQLERIARNHGMTLPQLRKVAYAAMDD